MAREISNGASLKGNLRLTAGTASLSPLTFQSGTNLTTAAAGAVEYDGKVIYSTPSGRGVSPSMMFYRLNSDVAGSNTSNTQSLFGVTLSLSASTVFAFELSFTLRKTSGTTSHTVDISFAVSSALNNIAYQGFVGTYTSPSTSGLSTSTSNFWSTSVGALTITASNTTLGLLHLVTLRGTLSTNSATTFAPSYSCSIAPGGAYSTKIGSYFAIWPIGAAGANVSVGPWA